VRGVYVEGILFDLDGTLIDSKKDLANSVRYIQKFYDRPQSSDAEVGRFIGDGVGKLVERATGIHHPKELKKAVKIFKAYYRKHSLKYTRFYPGVLQTLQHFKDKKMGIVTNKPTRISKHIIRRLGAAKYFGVILGGDSVTRKKPAPEGIRKAMKRLRLKNPKRVLMVGDGEQDIFAGRSACTLTCGLISNIADPQLLRKSKPDYTINSLTKLTRIIS
jgi:phosphoglycolate phosphatase